MSRLRETCSIFIEAGCVDGGWKRGELGICKTGKQKKRKTPNRDRKLIKQSLTETPPINPELPPLKGEARFLA